MNKRAIHIVFILLFFSQNALSQVSVSLDTLNININIDSLIADSIRKEYILSHKPLTPEEISAVVLKPGKLIYGKFLSPYLQAVDAYPVFKETTRIHVSRKEHESKEWIFYMFAVMLLFFAWVNHSNPLYLRNLFRVYVNEGFIFRQTKDLMDQSVFTSFLYNLLFILSGAIFLFFGAGVISLFESWERWAFLGICCLLIVLVYLVKFIFLSSIGWILEEKESFGNYIFMVYLNAKITGLVMLTASLLMAFSSANDTALIFHWVTYLIMGMIIIRLFRSYRIFARKVNLAVYLLAVLSIEILPNAMLLKLLIDSYELVLHGLM